MKINTLYLFLVVVLFLQTNEKNIHAQTSTQYCYRLSDGWEFLREDLGSVWEALRPAPPGSPQSVPVWTKVQLPHCFNAFDAVDPKGNYYQGPGWYRTAIKIKNPYPNGRIILHFEGAGQKTDVYIYTTKVATHVGGYDEWSVDITDAVREFLRTKLAATQFSGKVPISIRCDNSRDVQRIPSDMADFVIYGGIYRNLDLEYFPARYMRHLFLTASVDSLGKEGKLVISTTFSNPSGFKNSSVKLQVFDPDHKQIASFTRKITAARGEVKLATMRMNRPELWSPGHPVLYTCHAVFHSGADDQVLSDHFGFRNFRFLNYGPFELNGKRLLLKGTHIHEDHAGVGAAMTDRMMRTEIRLIKAMGANFIRLAHYQQSKLFLNLCDSVGIMVWEEIPWCRGGLGGNAYKNQVRQMLTHMIEQHRNHPSVIIWGLGNEIDWPGDFPVFDKQKIRDFVKQLNHLAHTLDPSRVTGLRRCDFCKDIPDVYSPSIWAGWYRGSFTEYRKIMETERQKVKHFIHIEWGGDSHAMRHSEHPDKVLQKIVTGNGADERLGDASMFGGENRVSKDGDWSETYICNLFDWYLKEQENMPWLTGSAFWIFQDFATPLRPDNPIPFVNQKGVVERDFTKKESYYVVQSYWAKKPMVHIYGHTWPVRWGDPGEAKMVKVYSNCPQAELFLNGKSCGVRKRNSQNYPAAGLRWIVHFKKGENHLRVVATQGKTVVTDEISQIYQTTKWGKPARMVLKVVAMKGNVATVEVRVFDQNQIMCLDAANVVRFSIGGDGKLLDDLGTSEGSRKIQLYNGRALIRVDTRGGESMVGVSSRGLPTVFTEIGKNK